MKLPLTLALCGLVTCFTAPLQSQDAITASRLTQIQQRLQDLEKEKAALIREHVRIAGTQPPSPSPGAAVSVPTPPPEDTSYLGNIGLKVRQSLKDKNLAENPAMLQYTMPSNGDDSYAVDIGVGVDLLKAFGAPDRHKWAAEGMVEYHYNSAQGALQDALLAGVNLQWTFGNPLPDTFDAASFAANPPSEVPAAPTSHLFSLNAAFKRDNLVSGEGGLVELLYAPYNPSYGIWTYTKASLGGMEIGYALRPEAGFQGEYGNGATKKFASGERLSFKAAMGISLQPFPTALKERLEWNNSLLFWSHLSTSGGFDGLDSTNTYFQSSLNFYFDDLKRYALGIDYLNGDNLAESKFDANTWNFAFKVKF